MPDIQFIQKEIERMRVQVQRQRREIMQLRRAGMRRRRPYFNGCSTRSMTFAPNATGHADEMVRRR
jgi:hypothetical protein